jgi:hypothetical protein
MTSEISNVPKRRSKWKALLLLLVVFFLGAAAGVGTCGAIIVAKLKADARNPGGASRPMQRFFDRTEKQLGKELELDPSERQAVHEELAVTSDRVRDIRLHLSKDVRTLARETVDRIASHLPPAKQSLLREKAAKRLGPWGLLDAPEPVH